MDAILTKKAEELAKDLAGQATTLNELNEVMRSLMKCLRFYVVTNGKCGRRFGGCQQFLITAPALRANLVDRAEDWRW